MPATPDQKAAIFDLCEDMFTAWSVDTGGGDTEFFSSVDRTFVWDTAGLGDPNPGRWYDLRLGLAALTGAYSRVVRPRDVHQRQTWRRWAIETVDTWFRDNQNPATGAMTRDGEDNGQGLFFGFPQVLLVAKTLGLRYRWTDQILAALDWSTGIGEKTWFINGNFQLSKSLSYWLGAWASDFDAARLQDFEDVIEFSYDPPGFLGNGTWLGYGFIEGEPNEYGPTGWFTETTTSNPGASQVGNNAFDPEYCMLQGELACLGYMCTGDSRYLVPLERLTNKLLPLYNTATGFVDCSFGSRHPVTSYSRYWTPSSFHILSWVRGRAEYDQFIEPYMTFTAEDFRDYLNNSHVNFYRGCGYALTPALLAAYGRVL